MDSDSEPFCYSHLARLSCPTLLLDQVSTSATDETLLGWLTTWHGISFRLAVGIIGRSPTAEFSVAHASVSGEHAQVSLEDGVRIVDLKSTNGTLVGPTSIAERLLVDGDLVRFGEVPFVFTTRDLTSAAGLANERQTVQAIDSNNLIALDVEIAGIVVDITLEAGCDGVVSTASSRVEMGPLETELLRILALRRLRVRSPELSFVSSDELLEQLVFHSVSATASNIRELVNRLRQKLATTGTPDLVESKRGVGYRLAGRLS